MVVSTVLAATLATAQPQPAPPVDLRVMVAKKVDHGEMDHGATKPTGDKAMAGMACCKDGCACCAKDKAKPAS